MSEKSEMVFVAFMQHCIQSTDFMSEMSEILYCTLHTVAPCPSKGEGYLDLFEPSTLFSGSLPVSPRRQLFKFLGLDNYKGHCRQDAQPIPNS